MHLTRSNLKYIYLPKNMTNPNFEILLGNFSFVILFLLMVCYWVQAIFSIIPKFNSIIFLTTGCANLSLLSLLIIRWINYGHFPLSNLYESLVFLSWSFTLIQLIFIGFLGQSNFKFRNVNPINYTTIIGIVLSPIALFTNSFATFSLPKTMQKAQALVPALQSNWLMMHVTVMMLSYTALLCGSLLSITFLIITWREAKNFTQFKQKNIISNTTWITTANMSVNQINDCEKTSYTLSEQTSYTKKNFLTQNQDLKKSGQVLLNQQNQSKSNLELELSVFAKTLDNLSYRILGIGFPLLTIGILSGAVWANEAWGSYWSWDPKETWAFITWLIFAIYLHTRITKGWEGRKPAILASFGFFIIWICYLGVNILGTGLHSYGWMNFKL